MSSKDPDIVGTADELKAELKAYKSQVERAQQQSEQTDKFVFGLMHDIRTHLRSVTSFTQLLARRLPPDPDFKDYVEAVLGSANEMNLLVQGVQQLTELSKERSRTTIRLDVLTQFAVLNLQAQIQDCGAQIIFNPMPEVTVEEGRLTKLFEELLKNSLRYRRTEPPKIDIFCDEGDERLTVSVQDNGEGIGKDYQAIVFEPFRRLYGRERSGIGLGLTICRRIVESHGGKIWVESDGQTGSTFRFTLPVQ